MSIPGAANPLLLASTSTAYTVSRSVRLNSADSAYFSRTPASAGTQTQWTWAAWVKRGKIDSGTTVYGLFGAYSVSTNYGYLAFYQDGLRFTDRPTAGTNALLQTTQVFRDPSAWYHLVLVWDGANSTSSDRVQLYVNGSRITSFSTSTYPSTSSSVFNSAIGHSLGRDESNAGYFDGYLADIHFIDGQALTPSSFAETNATTGQWVPKAYTGTYGTNGFKLNFADNSNNTATTLGKDTSGNGNNWTPFNLQTTTGGPTSVAAASGALPIYNTTDTYGAVKGTGTRTDSNSSSIVLAVPMDGTNGGTSFSDQSATIKGSGSAKTITVNGATTSTAQSKYYGSSAAFNGSSNLSVASTTDFDFSSINYTIELWFYADSTTISPHSRLFEFSSTVFAAYIYSDGTLYVKGGNVGASGDISFPAGSYFSNQWNHLAVVGYSDGTRTALLNGVIKSTTGGGSPSGAQSLSINGDASGNYRWTGYVSDFRVYRGVAKYTGNFNPPSATQNPTIAAGNDSLVDTPSSTGVDTGAGGEVMGNYATLQPLDKVGYTLTNGNLDFSQPGTGCGCVGSIAIPSSGKWYWEITPTNTSGEYFYGVIGAPFTASNLTTASQPTNFIMLGGSTSSQNLYKNSYTPIQTGLPFRGSGYTWGVAVDVDNNTLQFYVDNAAFGNQVTSALTPGVVYFPWLSTGNNSYSSHSGSINFGQRPFAFPVSGFKALCDTNLPAPVVAKPETVFQVIRYTGNGSTQTIPNVNTVPTTLAFSPDLVWIKQRSSTQGHAIVDSVRGNDKRLFSELTSAEDSVATVSSLNSDGFGISTVGGISDRTNQNAQTYVAWCWDAGSAANPTTNTQGSITSQVRANPSAGFSVVSVPGYTYPTKTAGHGLGVEPHFIITKNRGVSNPWMIYHKDAGANTYFQFDAGAGYTGVPGVWSGVSSTVFPINSGVNQQTDIIAYCFAPVAGYSSFGSYTGNGSTDGTFVYTGFRPRWILIKKTSATGSWSIYDSARDLYNVCSQYLIPNLSDAEYTFASVDLLSNGFKWRESAVGNNTSGATYIYFAVAESPFQYARAR